MQLWYLLEDVRHTHDTGIAWVGYIGKKEILGLHMYIQSKTLSSTYCRFLVLRSVAHTLDNSKQVWSKKDRCLSKLKTERRAGRGHCEHDVKGLTA